ncbi:MAG: hemolysin family protein [Candidatus Sericytochromatia bacterium]
MSLVVWLIIALLILVNAFYVAAEFATVSVRRSRVSQLAHEGNWMAKSLLPILGDPQRLDRYVAACQIGITLSSLILGAYGQATLAAALGPQLERFGAMGEAAAQSLAAVVVLIVLTACQVILGELVPKSLALQFPTQFALYLVLPMQWSVRLLAWFIALLNGSGVLILRAFKVPHVGHRHIHSPEEIELLMVESRKGGSLEADEHDRLHRAIQLSTRTARELMVPRLHLAMVDADAPPEAILEQMVASPYTRLPAYRGAPDRVIGILHTKDLALNISQFGPDFPVERLLRPVVAIPENVSGDRLLTTMRERRTHQLLVLDQYGGVAGLVTLEDVLGEMLGEMGDELKGHAPSAERLADGRVRLPALMRVDEAEAWISLAWPGEATTVGGQVLEAFGRLPAVGERVSVAGAEFEVERMTGHSIVTVLAKPLPLDSENAHG